MDDGWCRLVFVYAARLVSGLTLGSSHPFGNYTSRPSGCGPTIGRIVPQWGLSPTIGRIVTL